MCLPALGAAAAAAPLTAASLAISAIGTGFSMISAGRSAATAQAQAVLAHRNSVRQTNLENKAKVRAHIGAVNAQQESNLAAQNQVFNNNEAYNSGRNAEQLKLLEAKKAAAFKSQEIYAKSIGAKGKILASGRTGQSIGLLTQDVERQAGFAKAMESANLEGSTLMAANKMEEIGLQRRSANNQVKSSLGAAIDAPLFAQAPLGPSDAKLDIPTYDWG